MAKLKNNASQMSIWKANLLKEKAEKTLPKNRFELFKEIIKNQSSTMFKIGFLVLIIMLPLIITFLLTNIKIYEVNLLLSQNSISDAEAMNQITGYINARNILFIVIVPITFYILSGVFNVIRKIVWREGLLFWHDLKKGIKQNGGYFFIVSLIFAVIFFVFNYSLRNELVLHNTQNFIATIFSGIAFVIMILLMPFLFHQTIIYNLKFLHKIKNTLIIFSKLFYIFIILAVINVAPFLLLFINNGTMLLIILVFECIVFIPVLIVINTMMTDCTFDAFINHLHFKEIYRKGLMKYAEDTTE